LTSPSKAVNMCDAFAHWAHQNLLEPLALLSTEHTVIHRESKPSPSP
jgi:hypothetical protein